MDKLQNHWKRDWILLPIIAFKPVIFSRVAALRSLPSSAAAILPRLPLFFLDFFLDFFLIFSLISFLIFFLSSPYSSSSPSVVLCTGGGGGSDGGGGGCPGGPLCMQRENAVNKVVVGGGLLYNTHVCYNSV